MVHILGFHKIKNLNENFIVVSSAIKLIHNNRAHRKSIANSFANLSLNYLRIEIPEITIKYAVDLVGEHNISF